MRTLRIGTRGSQLALWQANLVKDKLEKLGQACEIIEISSTGDEVLDVPLHKIGGYGLFTKKLDRAMLNGAIDLAVHSLKDVPTDLPKKITQVAVLERANVHDVLIYKNDLNFLEDNLKSIIATGSLRRTAQWLDRYPNHHITGLRGNVNTRLQKLEDHDWKGAIFASAGLERINLLPKNHLQLDWMIPAPAQGAIMVTALEEDHEAIEVCAKINHTETEIAVTIERQFMNTLEGGCTAPIGGLATISDNEIHFKGILISLDGSQKIEVQETTSINAWRDFGSQCAEQLLAKGGKKLMARIKSEMTS